MSQLSLAELDPFVGKTYNAVQTELDRKVKAAGMHVRHLPPDTMTTMDLQVDRVNVKTNTSGRITSINIG